MDTRSDNSLQVIEFKSTPSKNPPLYQAVYSRNWDLAKNLLDTNADPNIINNGWSILSEAVLAENLEIVTALLEKKANPNLGDYVDSLPIYIAAFKNLYAITEQLLQSKANPNVVDPVTGNTPLLEAASINDGESIVRLLLKKEANALHVNQQGKTAIYHAVKNNNLKLIQELAPLQKDFKHTFRGDTLLHTAVKYAGVAITAYLCELKVDPSQANAEGDSPLAIAANFRKIEHLKFLKSLNLPTENRNSYRNILSYAAHNGFTDVVSILLNNEKKAKEYLDSRKHSEYRVLSIKEIRQGSQDYQSMMQNIVAPIIQQAWIKHHWQKHHVKKQDCKIHKIDYKAPLDAKKPKLSEPWGSKYEEHTTKIKAGEWIKLEFEHKDFQRDLHKAARLGAITIEEMVTASLLGHAKDEFKELKNKPILRKFSYEDSGPYTVRSISYISSEKLRRFYRNLKKLPQHEQCYFSANCDRLYEYYFLKRGLTILLTKRKFKDFLSCFASKLPFAEKDSVLESLDGLKGVESFNKETATASQIECMSKIEQILDTHYQDRKAIQTNSKDSAFFAASLLNTEEENPLMEISPDFDSSNLASPLLCRIIPTVSSFQVLQEVLHDLKHVAHPYFTVGMFSPKLIRRLDEKPSKSGNRQERPVEIIHPDIPYTRKPHGYESHPFELVIHDYLFHCFRVSALPIKPFVRHLRLLHDIKRFEMSKILWKLSDMDVGVGNFMRTNVNLDNVRQLGCASILKFLHRKDFFTNPDKFDDNLIILFDMVMKPNLWIIYLGISPYDFMTKNADIAKNLEQFNEIWQRVKNIAEVYNNYQFKDNSILFILAYRMMDNKEGLTALNNFAKEEHIFKKMFCWDRNGGVCIKKENTRTNQAMTIEGSSSSAIVELCVEINRKWEKAEKLQQKAMPIKEETETTAITPKFCLRST